MRVSFDTNILVYAADISAGAKHAHALELLDRAERADVILVLQSLAEFFHATTRRKLLSHGAATQFIVDWSAVFPVIAAAPVDLSGAINAVSQAGLSFWDAMLWSAANSNDCDILLTEDFQDGRRLGRVQFVNPFDPANARLVDTILPPP